MTTGDYRVRVSVRNNLLLEVMQRKGFENAAQLARAANVSPSLVGAYLNLQRSARSAQGEWRADVMRIADALHVAPEDIFNDQQQNIGLKRNYSERVVNAEQMFALMNSDDCQIEHDEGMAAVVAEGVDSLPERIAMVIRMRTGMDGAEHTLEEMAQLMGVTRERVRQIEIKGLRMLRARLRQPAIEFGIIKEQQT